MPQRTNDFQRLIAFVETQLAPHGATVTESKMLPTLDGTGDREVDVLIEGAIGDHPVRIALECRGHKRPQPVTWVEQLQGTYSNLPVDKVVAVSRSGFTKSALKRARLLDITTYTLKEALAADWPQEFTRWKVGLFVFRARLASALVTYAPEESPGLEQEALRLARVEGPGMGGPSTVGDDALRLYEENAGPMIREFIEKNTSEWFKQGPGKEWDLSLSFNAHNRFLISNDKPYRIREIILDVKVTFEIITAEHRHFTYREARITTTAVPVDSAKVAQFTILHDHAGTPQTLNIRISPTPIKSQKRRDEV